MGLLYTKFYMDFDEDEWRQVSNDPTAFQAVRDGVSLEIEDTSHKIYRLRFKKDGTIKTLRVTGKFRLTWDDDDLVPQADTNGG